MGEEKEKMKTGKKVIIALIIILLIFTAAAYGYGVHYFTDHFLPGSQVNGFNCSYKTADETEKLLAKETTEKRALPQKKQVWSTNRMAEPGN